MPRRSTIAIALAAALALALSACGGGNDGNTGGAKLKVVTSVSPITSIVENVGGTAIDLQGVIPEGVNSHTFEPPASTAAAFKDAGLIVLNGLKLDGPLLDMAKANQKKDGVILLLGDETISPDQYRYDYSFPQSAGNPNPHLWTDPDLAKKYAALVHDQLVKLDGRNKDYYDTNFNAYQKRLERLDQQIHIAAQTVPESDRKLLTYHDAWAYWAARYGFTVIGAIQPPGFGEPTDEQVAAIVDQVKTQKVLAIFGSEVFPSGVPQKIANETGVKFIDGLSDDDLPGAPGDEDHSYIGLMVNDMRLIISALGGDASPMDIVDTGPVFEAESSATPLIRQSTSNTRSSLHALP